MGIQGGCGHPARSDLSTRYYNTRGIAASCGNTRYYVLLNDRTIDRHEGDVSIATQKLRARSKITLNTPRDVAVDSYDTVERFFASCSRKTD